MTAPQADHSISPQKSSTSAKLVIGISVCLAIGYYLMSLGWIVRIGLLPICTGALITSWPLSRVKSEYWRTRLSFMAPILFTILWSFFFWSSNMGKPDRHGDWLTWAFVVAGIQLAAGLAASIGAISFLRRWQNAKQSLR